MHKYKIVIKYKDGSKSTITMTKKLPLYVVEREFGRYKYDLTLSRVELITIFRYPLKDSKAINLFESGWDEVKSIEKLNEDDFNLKGEF